MLYSNRFRAPPAGGQGPPSCAPSTAGGLEQPPANPPLHEWVRKVGVLIGYLEAAVAEQLGGDVGADMARVSPRGVCALLDDVRGGLAAHWRREREERVRREDRERERERARRHRHHPAERDSRRRDADHGPASSSIDDGPPLPCSERATPAAAPAHDDPQTRRPAGAPQPDHAHTRRGADTGDGAPHGRDGRGITSPRGVEVDVPAPVVEREGANVCGVREEVWGMPEQQEQQQQQPAATTNTHAPAHMDPHGDAPAHPRQHQHHQRSQQQLPRAIRGTARGLAAAAPSTTTVIATPAPSAVPVQASPESPWSFHMSTADDDELLARDAGVEGVKDGRPSPQPDDDEVDDVDQGVSDNRRGTARNTSISPHSANASHNPCSVSPASRAPQPAVFVQLHTGKTPTRTPFADRTNMHASANADLNLSTHTNSSLPGSAQRGAPKLSVFSPVSSAAAPSESCDVWGAARHDAEHSQRSRGHAHERAPVLTQAHGHRTTHSRQSHITSSSSEYERITMPVCEPVSMRDGRVGDEGAAAAAAPGGGPSPSVFRDSENIPPGGREARTGPMTTPRLTHATARPQTAVVQQPQPQAASQAAFNVVDLMNAQRGHGSGPGPADNGLSMLNNAATPGEHEPAPTSLRAALRQRERDHARARERDPLMFEVRTGDQQRAPPHAQSAQARAGTWRRCGTPDVGGLPMSASASVSASPVNSPARAASVASSGLGLSCPDGHVLAMVRVGKHPGCSGYASHRCDCCLREDVTDLIYRCDACDYDCCVQCRVGLGAHPAYDDL